MICTTEYLRAEEFSSVNEGTKTWAAAEGGNQLELILIIL